MPGERPACILARESFGGCQSFPGTAYCHERNLPGMFESMNISILRFAHVRLHKCANHGAHSSHRANRNKWSARESLCMGMDNLGVAVVSWLNVNTEWSAGRENTSNRGKAIILSLICFSLIVGALFGGSYARRNLAHAFSPYVTVVATGFLLTCWESKPATQASSDASIEVAAPTATEAPRRQGGKAGSSLVRGCPVVKSPEWQRLLLAGKCLYRPSPS
jgi:hypothetical protein